MIYRWKHMILEMDGSEGKLYINNQLKFKGDGYLAIKSFIANSNEDPEVKSRFQAQLNMREKPRFSKPKDDLAKMKQEAYDSLNTSNQKKSKKRK